MNWLTFSSIIEEFIGFKEFFLKMCLDHLDCFVCHCFELQQLILLFAMSQLYDKQLFLKVKEKLDQLHLNYQFQLEDLNLIAKLIAKIEEKENAMNKNCNKIAQTSTLEQTRYFNEVQEALNMEIVRLIRENSIFRRNLWQAREQILDLNSRMVQNYGQKIDNQVKRIDEVKILEMKDRRQRQLLSELEDIRYRYNELMDLIHENPTFQRQYIKRLLKKKKIVKDEANYFSEKQPQQKQIKQKHLQGKGIALDQLSIMKSKLLMRQQQIVRMQAMIQDNNNYIIYRHEQKKKSKEEKILKQQIMQLEKQNYQLKMRLKTLSSTQYRSKNKFIINSSNDIRQNSLQKKIQKEKSARNEKKIFIEGEEQVQTIESNAIKISNKALKEGQSPSQKNHQNQYGIKDKKQKPKSQRINSPPYQRKNPNSLPQNHFVPQANNKIQSKSHQNTSPKSKNNIKPQKGKQASSKEQAIIYAYQKLLQQKNEKINQLQAQLKTSPSRSTKIISAQNINSNNSQTNNVIVKTNKNEYITINSPTKNEENSQMQRNNFFMEQAYNQVVKQRQELKEQILRMQREKQQYSKKQKGQAKKAASKEQEIKKKTVVNDQSFQNKERVKQQLYQTQMALIKTNEQNLQIQKRLNELLLVQKNNPLSIRLLNQNTEKQIQHIKPDQALLQLQYLRREIKRLKIQMQGLYYQRQVLLARLKQLQGYLNKQSYQMRFFQEHVFGQQESYSSYIQEVKQLKNQSQVKRPF